MPEMGPLTDNDLDELKANLTRLEEAERLIEQATRAGIDVEIQKQRAKEARDRLMKLKQTFWPGR